MVIPGHDGSPAEPLDGIGNSLVIGSHQNPAHQRGLLNLAINVLYQRLSADFDDRFSGETTGIETGWDDCGSGYDLHQKHRTSS
jgi:hypothetical protein